MFANSFTEKQLDIAAGGCKALHAVADGIRRIVGRTDYDIPWGSKDAKL